MENNGYCVYRHITPNGKMYIGITSQKPQKRFNNGKGYYHNEHFKRAILLYGWENITHEILAQNLTHEQAIDEEKRLIAFYDSTNFNKGYNLMTGGDEAGTHTQSTKEKLRLISTGKKWTEQQHKKFLLSKAGYHHSEKTKRLLSEKRIGDKNPYFGKHHTEEEKAKVRMSMPDRKGEKSKLSKRVLQYDINGNLIKEYPAISVAGRENNLPNIYNISSCCRGRLKTSYGFVWRYSE